MYRERLRGRTEHRLNIPGPVTSGISPAQCLEYMDIDRDLTRIPDSLKDEYKNISDYHNAISSGLLDKWGELHEEKSSDSEYDPDWYKKFNDK